VCLCVCVCECECASVSVQGGRMRVKALHRSCCNINAAIYTIAAWLTTVGTPLSAQAGDLLNVFFLYVVGQRVNKIIE